MKLRTTHTFATLDVSPETFDEIYDKLKSAGYEHAFIEEDNEVIIDMNGIGLKEEEDV